MSAAAEYPLGPLLVVRHFREEATQRAVRAAEMALKDAEAKVREREEALARYRAWRPEEEERRYQAILGKAMTLGQIDEFKAGLTALRNEELRHEQNVAEAQNEQKKKTDELAQARGAAAKAQRETAKIAAHKDIWMAEYKKEAERQEEKELEDFKPVSFRGAEGDDA